MSFFISFWLWEEPFGLKNVLNDFSKITWQRQQQNQKQNPQSNEVRMHEPILIRFKFDHTEIK